MLFLLHFWIQLHCTPTACCPPEATPHENQPAHYIEFSLDKLQKEIIAKWFYCTIFITLVAPMTSHVLCPCVLCWLCKSISRLGYNWQKKGPNENSWAKGETQTTAGGDWGGFIDFSVPVLCLACLCVCVCVRVQGLANKPIIASLSPSLHKHRET